jgi:hypothetical protein
MKFETLMLKSFFAAAMLTCLLTLGAMLTTSTNAPSAIANAAPVVAAANAGG